MFTAIPVLDFETTLNDPSEIFASPQEVLDHAELSIEQKADILRRWKDDAVEAAVALEEGMPGPESDLLRQVLLAIRRLNAGVAVELRHDIH